MMVAKYEVLVLLSVASCVATRPNGNGAEDPWSETKASSPYYLSSVNLFDFFTWRIYTLGHD